MRKFTIVVQARTGSTRLPGKVLLPLAGAPLLERMLERLRAVRTPNTIIVATTASSSDDPLRDVCARLATPCYSGDPLDLLDRHLQAAHLCEGDTVVKIPSDCPLIDPAIVDHVLGFFIAHEQEYDFVSNLHPASYPDGNDVEVVPLRLLEVAAREAVKDYEREHTTPFFWDRPFRFRIGNVAMEGGRNYAASHRWTIDYDEDYQLIAEVYRRLWKPERPVFSMNDILELIERHPDIAALNARYAGVNWYRHHVGELSTISLNDTRMLHDE